MIFQWGQGHKKYKYAAKYAGTFFKKTLSMADRGTDFLGKIYGGFSTWVTYDQIMSRREGVHKYIFQ